MRLIHPGARSRVQDLHWTLLLWSHCYSQWVITIERRGGGPPASTMARYLSGYSARVTRTPRLLLCRIQTERSFRLIFHYTPGVPADTFRLVVSRVYAFLFRDFFETLIYDDSCLITASLINDDQSKVRQGIDRLTGSVSIFKRVYDRGQIISRFLPSCSCSFFTAYRFSVCMARPNFCWLAHSFSFFSPPLSHSVSFFLSFLSRFIIYFYFYVLLASF